MKRTIITFGGYFEEFIASLTEKERIKVDYLLTLLRSQDRLPIKFIKLIRESVYELRIEYNSNIYIGSFLFLIMTRLSYYLMGFRKRHRRLLITK